MTRQQHHLTSKQGGKIVGFKVLSEECIWMSAGVINYRVCDNAYDCSTCAFDKGMRKAMGAQKKASAMRAAPRWAEYLLKHYPATERPCRHVLSGRVDLPKRCPLNYECYHCAFDQWVEDTESLVQEGHQPAHAMVSGVPVAQDYYYHPGHSWVRFEHGGRLRIGVDGFAAHLFGPLNEIELPVLGSVLTQTQVGWTIHREGRSADMLAPADGVVVALNPAISEHPEMPHHDPYQHGWLMLVESSSHKNNAKRLLFGSDVFDWMERESRDLLDLLGPDYRSLAAIGGRLVQDVVGRVAGLDWNTLAERFLHTGGAKKRP
jgi:glycine cleavage system H lipoate-binding protein